MCRKIKCVCVNFDFIEFGGMTQRKFWYGLWCRSTSFILYTLSYLRYNLIDRSSQNRLAYKMRKDSDKNTSYSSVSL